MLQYLATYLIVGILLYIIWRGTVYDTVRQMDPEIEIEISFDKSQLIYIVLWPIMLLNYFVIGVTNG